MKNTSLIFGPPGTGKTTRLLNLVDEYIQKGIEPSKIGFVSFTKKSITEAKERAAKKFNRDARDFTYFRTIHSTAFYQLSMKKAEVMGRFHYIELGKDIGYKMTGIHRQDQMLYEMSKGDQLVFIESLARMMQKDYKELWNDMNPDFDYFELEHFAESLKKFKRSNLLYDFTDMLEVYLSEGTKPNLEVLFVDEAQDLCKLQWMIIDEMAKSSKRTYIAGDDDQAIFRWSGADIQYFQNLSKYHHMEVLSQSYRLPRNVFGFSNYIIDRIKNRIKKEYKPTPERGFVGYVSNINDIDMDKGKWLILVRNSYLIKDIVEYVRLMGLPYETVSYSVKDDESVQAAVTWEMLRKGRSETATKVSQMLDYVGKQFFGNQKFLIKNKEEAIDMKFLILNRVLKEGCQSLIWHNILTTIPVDDREYFISVRRREESLTAVPRIKISTIHGAKGGECDNVVLFTDMSNRTYKGMMENEEDELRVFYVGATRAKLNLFIVQPLSINHIKL